jgi:hypothetical protein
MDEIQFVEATTPPVCPHCNVQIAHLEYCKQRLSFGTMKGSTWVIVLACPNCHRVLGTQPWA